MPARRAVAIPASLPPNEPGAGGDKPRPYKQPCNRGVGAAFMAARRAPPNPAKALPDKIPFPGKYFA